MAYGRPRKKGADEEVDCRPSARERRLQATDRRLRLRAYLEEGLSRNDVAEETGWSDEEIVALEHEVLAAEERRVLGMRPEEVYIRYLLASEGNLRRLDELYDRYQSADQMAGLVGLVKTRQTIAESVLKRGQDFGFVRKEPGKYIVITANLTDVELQTMVVDKLTSIRSLMVRQGSRGFLEAHAEPSSPPTKSSATVPPRQAEGTGLPVIKRRTIGG